MNKTVWFLLALITFATIGAVRLSAQESSTENTITLYSSIQYKNERRSTIDFERGTRPPWRGRWDVGYGFLRAGEEFDWFQTGGRQDSRSVIRDLGKLAWTDIFTIPVVEPLAKLKPGEQRQVRVDTSGADGEDGAPGADADGVVRPKPNVAPRPPKRDGKPKVDPPFVKAIVGHLYVIHVVDDTRDFYALFRVESLTRGDNCTISWRLIPAPPAETAKNKK